MYRRKHQQTAVDGADAVANNYDTCSIGGISSVSATRCRGETVISIVVGEGDDTENNKTDKKNLYKPSGAEYGKLLGFIYAIVLSIIGFLLPLTEAIADKWLQTATHAAFLAYILVVGTVFIIYLQFYVLRRTPTSSERPSLWQRTRQRLVDWCTSCCRLCRRPAVKDDETTQGQGQGQTNECCDDTDSIDSLSLDRFDGGITSPAGNNIINNNNNNPNHTDNNFLSLPYVPKYSKASSTGTIDGAIHTSASKSGIAVIARYGSRLNVSDPTLPTADGSPTASAAATAVDAAAPARTRRVSVPGASPNLVRRLQRSLAAGGASGGETQVDAGNATTSVMDAMFEDNQSVVMLDGDDEDDSVSLIWMDLDKLGGIFSHEGSSFYLRIGALIFSLGNVIYMALEIESWARPRSDGCSSPYKHGWTFILRLIFIVVQTFFLFKGSKIHIVKHQSVAQFGFMHLIATNLCLWLRTLIFEINAELKHLQATPDNQTSSTNSSGAQPHALSSGGSSGGGSDCKDEALLLTVSRYLFPFILEYSLVAIGAIACVLFTGIGPDKDGNTTVARGIKNLIRVFAHKTSRPTEQNNAQSAGQHESAGHHELLYKSHCGVFAGILLLAGVITAIVLFFFAGDQSETQRVQFIYLITDIVLHGCLTIGCAVALFMTRHLAYVARPVSTDDGLLFLSMSGSFMFEVSIIIPTITQHDTTEHILTLTASLLAALQTVLQALTILYTMRRYPLTSSDTREMPGRGTITFLIIGNVVAWIFRTMTAKELDDLAQTAYYGPVPWLLLMNINLPLLLFYRFHSSVCFADVWHMAYTPVHRELVQSATTAPTADRQLPLPPRLTVSTAPSSPHLARRSDGRHRTNTGDSAQSAPDTMMDVTNRSVSKL